jgi:uncharacterized RDD family membrane protein YckC
MEGEQQQESLATLLVGAIGAAAMLIVPLLILYGLLWWLALGNPNRVNPALDVYASIWSLTAIGLALYHFWLAFRSTKSADRSKLFQMTAASLLIVISCPEFFY